LERFFSVVVETEDGRTETLRLSGASPGAAFQQAKQTPGVRRVGKVAELSSRTELDPVHPGGNGRGAPAQGKPTQRTAAPGRNERAGGYDPKVGFVLTGPRVVIHARAGGEQPFRNLQAPPEQFGPPKSLFLDALKAAQEAAAAAQAAEAARQAEIAAIEAAAAAARQAAEAARAASEPKYRIYKSRRRDGLPYLLQRGTWRDAGGKRLFEAGWEKGFAQRDEAERHLAWLERSEREMSEVGNAEVDDTDAEDDADSELEHADAEMDCQLA
jgi:hypothetical protein